MLKVRWILLLGLIALLALTVVPVQAQGNGRNTIIGEDHVLRAGQVVNGDLVLIGGRLVLEADSLVQGSVAVMGGELQASGVIEGDVVILGGLAELREDAVIEGDLVVFGELRRDPRAKVRGNIVEGLEAARRLENLPRFFLDEAGRPRIPSPNPVPATPQRPMMRGWGWIGQTLRLLATWIVVLVVAALVAIILPENVERIIKVSVGSPVLCLGVGLLTTILVAVLTPLLVVICIGIPVALVLLIAYAVSALVGWVAVGKLVGDRLLLMAKYQARTPLLGILCGTLLITAIAQVPCVGGVFSLLVLSLGIGGVVLSRFGLLEDPFWTPYSAPSGAPQGGPATAKTDTRPLDASLLPEELQEETPEEQTYTAPADADEEASEGDERTWPDQL